MRFKKQPNKTTEDSMKHRHFFGLAVMTVVVIITLAGCASFAEMFKSPKFPDVTPGHPAIFMLMLYYCL
jgi:hypothetical protein